MGRFLTVRLVAETYNDDDVFCTWPALCSLAWPGKGEIVGGAWRLLARPAALFGVAAAELHGVRELARAILEEAEFGDWDAECKERLKEGLPALAEGMEHLDSALANWQPQAANSASDALEDALDILEKRLRTK